MARRRASKNPPPIAIEAPQNRTLLSISRNRGPYFAEVRGATSGHILGCDWMGESNERTTNRRRNTHYYPGLARSLPEDTKKPSPIVEGRSRQAISATVRAWPELNWLVRGRNRRLARRPTAPDL